MNTIHDKECKYCGSSMGRRGSHPHCTGDNLAQTRTIFDALLDLEHQSPSDFARKVDNLRYNECNYDLFIDYWTKKKANPNAYLECLHEQTYFRDIHEEVDRLPIPDPYIPFPDLIEVAIAEIMLGRELTPNEKDGSRYIPKIDQDTGLEYFAPLTWIKRGFPHAYISLKDMYVKTDYTEAPLKVVFEVDKIRNKYASRSGDLRDE